MFVRVRARVSVLLISAFLPLNAGLAEETVLGSVTVLAQKREADLQDVPMSVTALLAEDLWYAGLVDVADVARREPTLDLQKSVSATTTSLRIRRVGSIGNIPTFEPAVGLFVDGAFRPRSLLGSSEFLDVERIEILRGPQSTLYGKNTSAGVVALYTKPPDRDFNGDAEATGGWLDTVGSPSLSSFKTRISGPLASNVGASLAAAYSTHGHTLSNALPDGPDGNNDRRAAFRGQVAWAVTTELDARLILGYTQEDDEQGESDVVLVPGSPSAMVAGVLREAGLGQTCADNEPHNRRSCLLATNTMDFETYDATLIGEYRLENGWTMTSVTAWDRYEAVRGDDDIGQLVAPILFFTDVETGRSTQQELRLRSADDSEVTWLVGMFYYRHDYERGGGGNQPMFGPNGDAAFHPIWSTLLRGIPLALSEQLGVHQSHLDTRYSSVFGNATWPITDKLSVVTNLRWQHEEKRAAINNSVTTPGASLISTMLTPSLTPGGEAINGAARRDSDNVTWSITPHYQITKSLMTYAEISRGAKSGGFNTGFGNASLTAREFGDEDIRHHELGTRATFAAGRARLSAAAFYTEYRDYQDAAFVSAQFSVGNAALVVLQGAEFESVVQLTDGLTADMSVSLADLTYATNTTGACFPGRTPDGTAVRSCNLAGEHPINAPVWAAHVGMQQQYNVGWGELYARVDWSWTDQYNTSFSADPRLVQKDSSDVALRVGVVVDSRYELILWVDNMLGEDVASIDAVLNLFNDASYQSFMTAPRSFGATVRVQF